MRGALAHCRDGDAGLADPCSSATARTPKTALSSHSTIRLNGLVRRGLRLRLHRRWPWPLPAVACWGLALGAWQLALRAGWGAGPAWLAGLAFGAALAFACCSGRWRRSLAAAGFPLSTLALGGLPALPAWAWLLGSLPLLLLYPVGAWRDAPLFPTPHDALDGLNQLPGLAAARRVLDAGCGLGHGLHALRRQWPQAAFLGLERSRLLSLVAAWRCPWARLTAGDMWAASWAGCDLVYLFQRPESMARALAKARQELVSGGWLVSLEFAVPGVPADACLQGPGRRSVWVYRIAAHDGVAPSMPDKQRSTRVAGGR